MDISEFRRLYETKNYLRHPWEIARGKIMLTLLPAKVPVPLQKLVDIGSGDAYVINLAYNKNIAESYFAIDTAYTDDILDLLRKNNNNSNIAYFKSIAEFQNSNPPEGQSIYLIMDVIEHLENEKIVLEPVTLAAPSKESAYFFISVPAFQSVFSHHDVLLGHYRRYTVDQLKKVCLSQGLTVLDSGYFFFSLLIARWFEKKLLRKKDYSIDNWNGSTLKTNFILFILDMDFKISRILKKIGLNLPGLSSYCICKL